MTAIYVALVIYMVVLFGVGLFYSKKNATINDFLLAGRDLGVVAATLTVTASLFGGGLLTGSAQYAYDSGPMMYVYGIVGSGGGLLLAALLVHKMKDFSNYGTITQYLEARYGSRFLRTGSAILSMIALISIVGSQVAAVLAMVVIIALTSMGGLKAVTVTDGFQIILVMIGVVWVTVVALGDVGGFAGLNSSLAAMTNELPADYNVFMTPAHAKTLLWMILPGFMYTMIGQDIYQRLFACKSHKVAIQTSVCSDVHRRHPRCLRPDRPRHVPRAGCPGQLRRRLCHSGHVRAAQLGRGHHHRGLPVRHPVHRRLLPVRRLFPLYDGLLSAVLRQGRRPQ